MFVYKSEWVWKSGTTIKHEVGQNCSCLPKCMELKLWTEWFVRKWINRILPLSCGLYKVLMWFDIIKNISCLSGFCFVFVFSTHFFNCLTTVHHPWCLHYIVVSSDACRCHNSLLSKLFLNLMLAWTETKLHPNWIFLSGYLPFPNVVMDFLNIWHFDDILRWHIG